jgi:hypothetical protein
MCQQVRRSRSPDGKRGSEATAFLSAVLARSLVPLIRTTTPTARPPTPAFPSPYHSRSRALIDLPLCPAPHSGPAFWLCGQSHTHSKPDPSRRRGDSLVSLAPGWGDRASPPPSRRAVERGASIASVGWPSASRSTATVTGCSPLCRQADGPRGKLPVGVAGDRVVTRPPNGSGEGSCEVKSPAGNGFGNPRAQSNGDVGEVSGKGRSGKPVLRTVWGGLAMAEGGGLDATWQTGQSGNKRSLPPLPGLPMDLVIEGETRCKNVKKQDLLTTKRLDSLSEYKVSTRPLLISPSPIQSPLSLPGHRQVCLPTLVAGPTGASGRGNRWFPV